MPYLITRGPGSWLGPFDISQVLRQQSRHSGGDQGGPKSDLFLHGLGPWWPQYDRETTAPLGRTVMVRRACIVQGCIGTGENASYCPAHAKAKAQARNRRRAASGDGAARRLRADVNRQAGGPCARCRRLYPASMLEIDHVTPIHAGGRDVLENLQVLCRTCHRIKTRGEGPGRSDLHTAPPWASGEGPGLWDRP